jgi:hypothetical protein
MCLFRETRNVGNLLLKFKRPEKERVEACRHATGTKNKGKSVMCEKTIF